MAVELCPLIVTRRPLGFVVWRARHTWLFLLADFGFTDFRDRCDARTTRCRRRPGRVPDPARPGRRRPRSGCRTAGDPLRIWCLCPGLVGGHACVSGRCPRWPPVERTWRLIPAPWSCTVRRRCGTAGVAEGRVGGWLWMSSLCPSPWPPWMTAGPHVVKKAREGDLMTSAARLVRSLYCAHQADGGPGLPQPARGARHSS